MDANEIKQFLTETEDGQAIANELKQPLLSKRDELFQQMKSMKDELDNLKATEATKVAELEQATRQEQEQKLKVNNDFEAYKQFHDEEIQKYKQQVGDFQTRFAQKEAERVITETAAKYSNSPKPLQLLLREHIKPSMDEQGNVRLDIYGEDGNQMYFDGEPASVDHLVEKLKTKEDYAPFFAGSGVSGAGTTKSETVSTSSYKDSNSPDFNLTRSMGNKI